MKDVTSIWLWYSKGNLFLHWTIKFRVCIINEEIHLEVKKCFKNEVFEIPAKK